jgi:hypothetical protein
MPDTPDMPDTDHTDAVDDGTPNPTVETTDDPFEPERAMATIKKLRGELKNLTKEHRDAIAKLTQIEDAQLSETERLQKQLADVAAERDRLAGEARRSVVTVAIADAAAKAGAIRPDAIARLIDLENVEIADGKAVNAADLVKAVAADYPELFRSRPGTADAAAGKAAAPAGVWQDTLRRQLTS